MAVTSVSDFFKLLEKSSLLSAEQCQAARQQLAGESDPKMVARKLISEGRLTKWQALQLLNGRSALSIGPYRLREALSTDNAVRAFRAQHAESGQLVEVRSLSRSRVAERPEALEEFVADAEKAAGSSERKVLEVHRPDGKDETCYVVLEDSGSGAPAAAALLASDSSTGEPATAPTAGPAEQSSVADSTAALADTAQVGVQETAKPVPQEAAPAAADSASRPPKLKTRTKPEESAPAQAGSEPAATADKALATDKAVAADEPSSATPADSKLEIKIVGVDNVVPVSGAPAEFKIAKGKRRKAGTAAGRPPKPSAGAAEGDAKAAPASAAKRTLSPAMLIGGAVGGGLLLVAIVVVIWLLASGGSSPEVADAGGGKPPAEQAKQSPQEGETKPDESADKAKPAASEPADPVAVVSDPVVDVQPAAPALPVAKPDVKSESGAAKTEPAANGAKPAEMPATPASAGPTTAKPGESPAGEPGKESAAAKPGKEDATKPKETKTQPKETKTEPKGKEPPAKESGEKKEPAKPADKKPSAPPPGKKPFADLKAVAKLPDVSAAEPMTLGPIYIPAGELCFVKLRGGEKARKGAHQFVMKNAREGLADKEWEISVRDAAGSETIVASMAINDKSQLVFQWSPNAKAQDLSPYLCNCVFALSCAGDSKEVILREPVAAEALSVDFDKPTTKHDWKIDVCPDPDAVRFEITGVQGAKFSVDPKEPQSAEKATAWVKVEDGGGLLSLKIDASLKRDFQLTATPYIKMSPEAAKPEKFIKRMFQTNVKNAEAQSQQAGDYVKKMQDFVKSKAPEGERKQVEQRLSLYEMESGKMATLFQNMKRIDDLLKSLADGMKIQFRVYYDAASTEVVLLKSGS